MLPDNKNYIKEEEETSKTYNININSKHIIGMIDGKDALLQSIQNQLNIQRYESLIYNNSYGIETDNLIGKNIDYVKEELKRIIKDCFNNDNRILNIDNFNFNILDNNIEISLTFNTIYGEINYGLEVKI